MSPIIPSFFKNAPRIILGAFFLCASCKQESPQTEAPEAPEAVAVATKKSTPKETTPAQKPEQPAAAENEVRFLSYNLKNYLTMDRFLRGAGREPRSKPEEEIEALVKIIVDQKPDILGVCEIGSREDLLDLQSRLKKEGLDLPHLEHAGGMDRTRRLGLLSALPISARNSQSELPYKMNGKDYLVRRGILDVTIDLPNGPTHFIGLHLKSKRPSKEYDESEMRLNEARLARKHINAIQEKNPGARVVLYGDMNETRRNPPIKAMQGNGKAPNFLEDVYVKDSRYELWTHFWSYQQQYARFDFVFVSRSLKPEVNMKRSYIADPANWFVASDHRAIMVAFGK